MAKTIRVLIKYLLRRTLLAEIGSNSIICLENAANSSLKCVLPSGHRFQSNKTAHNRFRLTTWKYCNITMVIVWLYEVTSNEWDLLRTTDFTNLTTLLRLHEPSLSYGQSPAILNNKHISSEHISTSEIMKNHLSSEFERIWHAFVQVVSYIWVWLVNSAHTPLLCNIVCIPSMFRSLIEHTKYLPKYCHCTQRWPHTGIFSVCCDLVLSYTCNGEHSTDVHRGKYIASFLHVMNAIN